MIARLEFWSCIFMWPLLLASRPMVANCELTFAPELMLSVPFPDIPTFRLSLMLQLEFASWILTVPSAVDSLPMIPWLLVSCMPFLIFRVA